MNFYVRKKSKNKNIGAVLVDLNTLFSEFFWKAVLVWKAPKLNLGGSGNGLMQSLRGGTSFAPISVPSN